MADMPTPERGINKKLAAAAVLAGGIALGGLGYVATRGEPTPTQPPATATPSAAAASPTPKETPTPTVARTPEATPTKSPEFAFAKIEGLRFDPASKKYFAEAGNPYGLEVNAYAGEQVIYVLGQEQTSGVVLTKEVVRMLSSKANTPEEVTQEKWQIPLALDPRRSVKPVKISEEKFSGISYLAIGNLSEDVVFVSPFIEDTTAVTGVSTIGGTNTTLNYFPNTLTSEKRTLGFNHFGEPKVKPGQKVSFGQGLFSNVQGEFRGSFPPNGTQAIITVGGSRSPVNISFQNILTVDNQKVFLAQNQ